MLAALRKQGLSQAEMARSLGRHRSTVCREFARNCSRFDGHYRPSKAQERTQGRRSRSRRNLRFSKEDFALIEELLCRQWSPEQVAGHLRRTGRLSTSHETIYRHVWRDKAEGGLLYTHPRGRASGGGSATAATMAAADSPASARSRGALRRWGRASRSATGGSTP